MIQNRLFIICCISFIVPFTITIANGKESLLVLSNPEQQYKPVHQVLIFEDKSRMLNFRQILTMDSSFRKNEANSINRGISHSALWCKLRLKNKTNEKWYLQIGEPYIDYIDVYSTDLYGNIDVIKTGLIRGFNQRSIRVNHFFIPLELGFNEEKTYYVRAQSNTILKLPLVINTIQNHFEINHREDLTNGIYFGLIFALSLYNLFVFLLLKDKTYLYYVLYINFLGATIAWLRGYSPEFLSHVTLQINHGNNYAALTFVFLTLFTHSFLNLEKLIPKHKWLVVFFFAISILTITLTLAGRFDLSFYFVMLIVFINLPYIAFFGIAALRKGFRPAIFYILGFSFFTLGDFIFILSENARLQQTLLGNYSLQIGSAIEALILSFALANKLNLYKKEKEDAQEKALKQANAFAKELIQTQEAERKRIAGELHDSVGQSLSLLKNRLALIRKSSNQQNSLEELNNQVANTIQEIRTITYGLRPFQLDLLGLTQSLRSLTENFADAVEIQFHTTIENIDGLVSKDEEIYIFRIVQECLNNILKHSQASEATIEIIRPNGSIHINISDNGTGMDQNLNGKGFGLIGIKERLTILNGTMEIRSNHPKGAQIMIQIASHHN